MLLVGPGKQVSVQWGPPVFEGVLKCLPFLL